ncbi:hypothetical protein GOP47_0001046 [Adiantum capillus-veneris]|uniref:histidine kinase n=1 Tax=Adiantum capillus-veneris TaxID=13818 RepID=A0A9D4ZTI3_ADICA|nr:hypothetical protein GOP47_0001046 [Adiantum capillus-veneris]
MTGCCTCLCPHRAWMNVPPNNPSHDTPGLDHSLVIATTQSSPWRYRQEPAGEDEDFLCRTTKSLRASICLKLTIFVAILVVVAAGIPALVLWLKAHEQLVEEIERRLITVSTLRQEQLRDYLNSETDKTELIGTRVLVNNYLANTTGGNRSLAQFDLISAVEVISDFAFAACYDREGQLAMATDYSVFENMINPNDLEAIGTEKLQIAFPVQTPFGWMYNISRAIYRKQTVIGVLMTWVNATKLVDLVYDRTGLQTTGELLIGVPVGEDKVRLLFPPFSNQSLVIGRKRGAMARAVNGESGIMTLRDYSGSKVIAAYRPVGFLQWGLLAKLDMDEAYAPVKNVRTVIIITIIVLVFFGVLASLGLAKIFSRPIVELGRAAVALGQGDMSTRVTKGTVLLRDELADLKDIFNSMAHQLAHHHQILEQTVAVRTADLARANEGLAKEINERRRIEMELEKAKNIAMAANKSKSEFLANMSHEIRTPLNAIVNFTDFCLETEVTPEQKEHLEQVQFAAQHLLRLITDILDFSKIEAGKLEIEEIEFSLFDQLEHAVSVLAARALEDNIELCCSIDNDVPDLIMGDPGRLLQIFVNLIGNGIKFTKEGEVVVSVSVKSRLEDIVELLFAVKDTGLGIPKDKQPILFQAFSQVDSSTQRLYGGTGLGLVISAKLATAMKGAMWVESDGIEDHGSTFWFTAKFRLVPSSNTERFPLPVFKDVRGLVVDDNETNRRILVNLLKSWGMKVQAEGSVEAALSVLQHAANLGQKFNVLLLDLRLKGTDASELISALHQEPALLENRASETSWRNKENVLQIDGSKDIGREESISFGGSLGDQEAEIAGENKLESQKSESLLLGRVESTLETVENKSSFRSDVNNHSILSASEKAVPGSFGKPNQQNDGDIQSVNHALGRVKVSRDLEQALSCVIMLTSVDHTDMGRCKELGVMNHVSKPTKRALLARLLQKALGAQDDYLRKEDETSKVSESSTRSLHVLVAEDNIVNQQVALKLLQKWGHTAVLARNGAEAVEKATKEQFDLIFMDVQMPLCDGFEATAQIREFERSKQKPNPIPIVAMTAHAMCGDGERCIAAGMDYYISKPLESKKLRELLQNLASQIPSRSLG